jgi:hypothetical protein
MSEKRNHQRVEIRIRVASKDNRIVGYTRNLSVGGCFIECSDDLYFLPIGSKIQFYLEIPGDYAYMEIDVMIKHYGKEDDGMGIGFETTNHGIKSLIANFMSNFLGLEAQTTLLPSSLGNPLDNQSHNASK